MERCTAAALVSLKRTTNWRRHLLRNCFCTAIDAKREQEIEVNFTNGRNLRLSTGRMAKMADGSAVGTLGDTSVMVTIVSKSKPPGQPAPGFLPLTVDYRQKSSATGRIPTNHLRRELGTSDREILTSRLIDRSVRPLFPKSYTDDTQLVCNLLAADGVNAPDVVAINAASAALALSGVPWNGPIGAVRVGLIDDEVIVNPTRAELKRSQLNLIVTATKQNLVVMLDGSGDVYQQDFVKAIKVGTREVQHVIGAIERLQKSQLRGTNKPTTVADQPISDELNEAIRTLAEMRIKETLRDYRLDKLARDDRLQTIRADVAAKLRGDRYDCDGHVADCFNRLVRDTFRQLIFDDDVRCDGRRLTELRPIDCRVDLFRPLHGSALFQRGQTQVFCTVTLDSPQSALKLDPVGAITSGIKEKNFFLHYEFPPYATREIGKLGPSGRRELGHGALAEKALFPVVPTDFPFTIRLTSEVMESNGSSSMASVCGGSLALMDAGVPINGPAAGVAIGLVTKYNGDDTKHIEDYRLLTDILGIEDYMGDMDFKLAGTKKTITAIQADVKIPGLPLKIVFEAVQRATEAKTEILNIMANAIDKPRPEKKDNWPVSKRLEIEPHKRARLFGTGGIHLKRLFVETGVQVSQIDENAFEIFAPDRAAMEEAEEKIGKWMNEERAPDLEFGGIYKATVVEVRDIGVMVTLYTGMPPALLHNSQLDQRKISHPSALGLEVGNELQVKYFGRDPVSGLMRLSRKVLQTT